MDEVITKRIHISGLTPAITSKNLSDRLGSFGTVKAMDGFGALDNLGQPRKFAYATLETTKGKLARCTFHTFEQQFQALTFPLALRHEPVERSDMEGCEASVG